MVTQAKVNTLKILKKASKENDAPIWAKVADYVQKSRSNLQNRVRERKPLSELPAPSELGEIVVNI